MTDRWKQSKFNQLMSVKDLHTCCPRTMVQAFQSALSVALLVQGTSAWVPVGTTKRLPTQLSVLPPPLIIGPMIKKMKEESDKKKMPMAEADEARGQAPGLRVGKNAWKWPPIWPYDASFFLPAVEAQAQSQKQQMNDMASMLTGIANAGAPAERAANAEEPDESFNSLGYWGGQSEKTNLDPEAAQKLREHYSYYLKDGMSILEFGAAEESYLPITPSRHVGVGANAELMAENPSLTERMVVDLNQVVPGRDIDNDDIRRLAQGDSLFDAIVMANTVDFLSSPREVFRSAWYLLKPGGVMIVSFQGKEATKDKFTEAQTIMWKQYNDDQHMWITGSFFQFSAGDGWESLLGFDLSPESAKDMDMGDNPLSRLMKRGKANNLFAVQAVKGFQDDKVDPQNAERSIRSLCWMLPTMEERDKNLVVPRLARAYETAEFPESRAAIERNLQYLPVIYESLIKMDQFAFTFAMQAQMAADLVSDPDFEANDEQILALKQGLGLRTPSPEFWVPIGQRTGAMEIEDRISLLGFIVPCFGSKNPAQEEALQTFVDGLEPTYKVIRSKCPSLPESDVQLLGTELLAAEILKPGKSTRLQFAQWLNALTSTELLDLLSRRKEIRIQAKKDLIVYKEEQAQLLARREEYQRKMQEQMEQARANRSLVFDPKSQKMVFLADLQKK